MPLIREITLKDNETVAAVIRKVMPEFGAGGPGFAIHDREVDDMYAAYNNEKSAYFVCEDAGKILGGGGVGPLTGGPADTCELKKMYFLPEGRGKGLGQLLLSRCIESAKDLGYAKCYLETFNTMKGAMKLYEKNHFERIKGPLGRTGHFACDTFYLLELH